MKYVLKIYKNNEIVNTMQDERTEQVYKQLASILYSKEVKRASKTKITKQYNGNLKIVQYFDKTKTMLDDVYKYDYIFTDVEI